MYSMLFLAFIIFFVWKNSRNSEKVNGMFKMEVFEKCFYLNHNFLLCLFKTIKIIFQNHIIYSFSGYIKDNLS